jgi:flagellar motor switch protein FliG
MAPALDVSPEVAKMTRAQKLAALLIILGPDSGAQILKDLDDQHVTAITSAMAALPTLSQDMQQEILAEFSDMAVHVTTALRGGIEFAQNTLEKALGSSRASEFLDRVAPGRATKSSVLLLAEKEPRQIFGAIRNEQPQAIALAVSFLEPKKASEVLNFFAPEVRDQIIERLATLGPTPTEVVEILGRIAVKRIGVNMVRTFNQTGGVQPTATLLNAMNKDTSRALLDALNNRNPELTAAIRNKMFTFEDLVRLDVAALQKILREVDSRNLAIALKGASEKVKTKLLSGLSKRAAEALNEEISFLGKIKPKEIEAAQLSIIQVVRRLEGEGQIELNEETENA